MKNTRTNEPSLEQKTPGAKKSIAKTVEAKKKGKIKSDDTRNAVCAIHLGFQDLKGKSERNITIGEPPHFLQ